MSVPSYAPIAAGRGLLWLKVARNDLTWCYRAVRPRLET
jgi:hypothetical protein